MIEHRRFDYLPLGANEFDFLFMKYQKHSPNVIVEQNIVLIYPFGRLFFVNKNNQELHDAVYQGLVKSFLNGSFWQLFKSHKSNRVVFKEANLKARKQLVIDNPYLTSEFKRIPKEYFFGLHMLD